MSFRTKGNTMQAVAQVAKASLQHAFLNLQTPMLWKVQPIPAIIPDLGSDPLVKPLLTLSQYAVFVTDIVALVTALIQSNRGSTPN